MFQVNKIYKTSRNDIAMNIRFPEETYKRFKQLSAESGHSFNSLVINAMNYALDNLKQDKKWLIHIS